MTRVAAPPLTRRQRDILDFFCAYRKQNGISPTLEEIAQNFGLNKVTIFGHVAELERKGILTRAARGVSRGLQLVEDEQSSNTSIPIRGTIAAGAPIEALEQDETLDLSEIINPNADTYILKVRGDSMIEDAICDGDMVLIERRDTANNGETVVAVLPSQISEEATLKRYYKEGDRIRLQPANSSMQPIYTTQVEIRGVVVGVIRRF